MSRLIAAFLVLSTLTLPKSAAADGPPIRDGAKLFSPEAVARATDELLDIRETASINLVLETTDTLPDETLDRLHRAGNPDRAFSEIAEERARAADIHGIYVYICKIAKPKQHRLAVVVWPEEYEKSFTNDDREKLRKALASRLEKHPDEALHKAVEFLREKIKSARKAEASWFGWGMAAALIGGLLGLWLILGLIRMRLHRGASANPEAGNATAPHAGLVPGLLGGMFGSVAGFWIYDTLFESPPHPPRNAEPTHNAPEAERQPSGQGTGSVDT